MYTGTYASVSKDTATICVGQEHADRSIFLPLPPHGYPPRVQMYICPYTMHARFHLALCRRACCCLRKALRSLLSSDRGGGAESVRGECDRFV